MEFSIPFGGQALNAVDGKGCVSLPADLRATVDRRAAQAKAANMPVDDKLLYISEDEELPCLTGFDETEYFALAAELRAQRARNRRGRTQEPDTPASRCCARRGGASPWSAWRVSARRPEVVPTAWRRPASRGAGFARSSFPCVRHGTGNCAWRRHSGWLCKLENLALWCGQYSSQDQRGKTGVRLLKCQ